MISERNFLVHELIGLRARVVSSSSASLVGLRGLVVDETKNTFVFEEKGREFRVPKAASTFAFALPGGKEVVAKGSLLAFSPVERLKKLAKKVW